MKNIFVSVASATVLFLSTCWQDDAAAQTVFLDQGKKWTESRRAEFYFTDQGSRIMPLAWMRALRLPDGKGFLDDALARYGYLPDATAPVSGIPVGFTVSPAPSGDVVGMTCAACHTREIKVNGLSMRIDGGPAMVDFQAFLVDLNTAVASALDNDANYSGFAERVLGQDAEQDAVETLRSDIELWQNRFGTLVERSLDGASWGPGRLDAISMIFNRLTGLDLGEAPTFLIPENIQPAIAPTRYPFLWNAVRQDKTQWPGFADNGNDLLGLARNLGQVYGVFGEFRPEMHEGFLKLNRDYITKNSANFDGLRDLEDLLWKLGPPKWPWAIDETLAAAGKAIFERSPQKGGCVACHGIETGETRSLFHRTWKTPVQDVGTDTRQCEILAREVNTGILTGAKLPFGERVGDKDLAFNVLATSVIGAIVQHSVGYRSDVVSTGLETDAEYLNEFAELRGAFPNKTAIETSTEATEVGCAYEARVLEGIWATAPYLHNGSVATLADLLRPASERQKAFKLGANYDIVAVGLAAEQNTFKYSLETTGCDDVHSGNSRCGHEYGTSLSVQERRALLEYLKTL